MFVKEVGVVFKHSFLLNFVICPRKHLNESVRCPIRELTSARVGSPRVVESAICPVTLLRAANYLLCHSGISRIVIVSRNLKTGAVFLDLTAAYDTV